MRARRAQQQAQQNYWQATATNAMQAPTIVFADEIRNVLAVQEAPQPAPVEWEDDDELLDEF